MFFTCQISNCQEKQSLPRNHPKEAFTCCVIYLFISSVRFQLEDVDGSRGTFKKAIEVICRKRPEFLMPSIGTYLFDSIRSELQSRAVDVAEDSSVILIARHSVECKLRSPCML